MGYDTTLHLVDTRAFAFFEQNFAAPHPEDETMPELVRRLDAKDPSAGRMLTELLLAQVSVLAPYLVGRNVALSLWSEEELGVALPAKFLSARLVDELPAIRAKYPSLTLPNAFSGNYCTGVYVPAALVPELAAFIETTLSALPEETAWWFRKLRRVIAVAAERGLGYWEGTEVGVAEAPHVDWLEDAPPSDVEIAPAFIQTMYRPFERVGDRVLAPHAGQVLSIDLSTFPPLVEALADAPAACTTPWGTELSLARSSEDRPWTIVEFFEKDRAVQVLETPFDVLALSRAGRDVIAIPMYDLPERPMLISRGMFGKKRKLTRLDVPPRSNDEHAVIPVDDRSYLLVWNGDLYRGRGSELQRIAEQVDRGTDDRPGSVTLADGSVVIALDRGLVRITRDNTIERIAGFDDPRYVSPGPDGTVVVQLNSEVAVWWPATREIARIAATRWGLEDGIRHAYASSARMLVAFGADDVRALSWDAVSAMPREKASIALSS